MEDMWPQQTGVPYADEGTGPLWGDRVTGEDVGPARFGTQNSQITRNA
jgi:hypothetical protein